MMAQKTKAVEKKTPSISFAKIKQRCDGIKSSKDYENRKKMYQEIEYIYLMIHDELPKKKHVKKTLSTSGRDAMLQPIRLVSKTHPTFSVPYDKSNSEVKKISDQLEKFLDYLLVMNGQVKKKKLMKGLAVSAFTYSEIIISVTRTSDIIRNVNDPTMRARLERIQKKLPIVYELLSPKVCYPVYDNFGLAYFYIEKTMKVSDLLAIIDNDTVRTQIGDKKKTQDINFEEYWDHTTHAVWINGNEAPILHEDHGLPQIPIASRIVEDTELMFDPSDNEYISRQPYLYGMWKSNNRHRQDTILSVIYTGLFALAANGQFIYKANKVGKKLRVNWNKPGGVITIEKDEEFMQLAKQSIDPAMLEAYNLNENTIELSTMFKTAFGQSMGSNTPFSTLSYISQLGRIPLLQYEEAIANAISEASLIAIDLLREDENNKFEFVTTKRRYRTNNELVFEKIPDDLIVEVGLKVRMPQDQRQNLIMYNLATQTDESGRAATSQRYAREEFLGIGQSDEMQFEIWEEAAAHREALKKHMLDMAEMEIQIAKKRQEMMTKAGVTEDNILSALGGSRLPRNPNMIKQMVQAGAQSERALKGKFEGQVGEGNPALAMENVPATTTDHAVMPTDETLPPGM